MQSGVGRIFSEMWNQHREVDFLLINSVDVSKSENIPEICECLRETLDFRYRIKLI